MTLWFASLPLLGLFVNATCQMALARLPLTFGQVRRQFLSCGLGSLIVIAGWLAVPLAPILDQVAWEAFNLTSYLLLSFIFFNALNANLSSLRVRLVKELARRGAAGMERDELLAKYGAREILTARLARLESGGQIQSVAGRYVARPKGVAAIGRFFAGLRQLLLPRES